MNSLNPKSISSSAASYIGKVFCFLFMGSAFFILTVGAISTTTQVVKAFSVANQRSKQFISLHENELLNEIALKDEPSLLQHLGIIKRELNADQICLSAKGIKVGFPSSFGFACDTENKNRKFSRLFESTFNLANEFQDVVLVVKVDSTQEFKNGIFKPMALSAFWVFLISLFPLGFGYYLIFRLIKKQLLNPVSDLTRRLRNRELGYIDNTFPNHSFHEIEDLKVAGQYFGKLEREATITEIASQVAHDIRSPLSALTMVVGTLKEIPEDKRILIRNATQRINDISNDLLQKGQKNDRSALTAKGQISQDKGNQNESQKHTTEFIPVLIDILVSEKRMQYREYPELEIEADLKDSFGAFARINSNELKRVISNLINNCVEAFNDHKGQVKVGVKKTSLGQTKQVEIKVKDNGKGIPQQILTKLGQMGVSHGKDGMQSGSGLGVYHAKKTVESFGGTFEIESQVGQGTLIRLTFPLADSPPWFAIKIDLTGKKYLVSLDDDISIHQIWSGRLQSAGYKHIEHIRFQSGEAFDQFVQSNFNILSQILFLVDYELLNQPRTGLDLIEALGLEKYSILVTSRYEESNIQSRASHLCLSLLPKTLAGFVPFEMVAPKERYDLTLIDDDIQKINRLIDTDSSPMKSSE